MNKKQISPEKLEELKERQFQNKLKSYNKHLINQRENNKYLKERENINLIRVSNRKGLNCLRWSSNETDEHIQMKLEICKWLKRNKFNFYCEAIFKKSGKRCDIFDITRGIILEVLDSEKNESCLEKTLEYPDVEIRMIRTDKELKTEDLE